jgi:hypothetical protein
VSQPFLLVCYKSNTTGVTSVEGTAYHSGTREFSPVFSGICVARSLVFCALLYRSLLVFICFGHCIICPSLIYGFWLPLWYLQTFLFNYLKYNILGCMICCYFKRRSKISISQHHSLPCRQFIKNNSNSNNNLNKHVNGFFFFNIACSIYENPWITDFLRHIYIQNVKKISVTRIPFTSDI